MITISATVRRAAVLLGVALTAVVSGCSEDFATAPGRFASSVQLRNWSDTMMLGDSATIVASVLDDHGREVMNRSLSWTLESASVVGLASPLLPLPVASRGTAANVACGAPVMRAASAAAGIPVSSSGVLPTSGSLVLSAIRLGTTAVTFAFEDELFTPASRIASVTVLSAGVAVTSADTTVLSGVGDTATVSAMGLAHAFYCGDTALVVVPGLGIQWTHLGLATALLGEGDDVRVVGLVPGTDTLIATMDRCHPSAVCADTVIVKVPAPVVIIPPFMPPMPLAISPANSWVWSGSSVQFTASGGFGAGPYVWSVNGTVGGDATVGTIDPNGLYRAPSTLNGTVQVCAQSMMFPSSGCTMLTVVWD